MARSESGPTFDGGSFPRLVSRPPMDSGMITPPTNNRNYVKKKASRERVSRIAWMRYLSRTFVASAAY